MIRMEAIVLKRQLWREYDLIIDLYTAQAGMIRTYVFGAAKSHSERGQHCSMFKKIPIELRITIDRSRQAKHYHLVGINHSRIEYLLDPVMYQSNQIEIAPFTKKIIACAYYVTQCYLYLAEQIDDHACAFDLYTRTLKSLNLLNNPTQTSTNIRRIHQTVRQFELELLCLLSYELNAMIPNDHSINTYWWFSLESGWQSTLIDTTNAGRPSYLLKKKQLENLGNLNTWSLPDLQRLKKHNQRLFDELSQGKIQRKHYWIS